MASSVTSGSELTYSPSAGDMSSTGREVREDVVRVSLLWAWRVLICFSVREGFESQASYHIILCPRRNKLMLLATSGSELVSSREM